MSEKLTPQRSLLLFRLAMLCLIAGQLLPRFFRTVSDPLSYVVYAFVIALYVVALTLFAKSGRLRRRFGCASHPPASQR